MKTTTTAAALIALSLAAPAMAQQTDSTGIYGAIHGGINLPDDQRLTVSDVQVFTPPSTFDTVDVGVDLDTKRAAEFGGAIGYDFGRVRTDIDVSYSRATVKGLTLKSVDGAPAPADALENGVNIGLPDFDDIEVDGNTVTFDGGKMRRLSAMASAWIDLPLGNGIAPYVGGGLGIQDVKFAGVGKSGFTWQLGAGASLPLGPRLAVSADYRYRQQKGLSVKGTDLGDLRFDKATSSSIFVSLRYSFGTVRTVNRGDCSGPC